MSGSGGIPTRQVAGLFGDIETDAVISACGTYRYELTRRWEDGPLLGWVMLNPSTADASIDDPTIRRCIGFAKSWNFAGIRVTNRFALRATNPRELLSHPDPFGPDNARYLSSQPATTIAAWGAHKLAATHEPALKGAPLLCLGRTSSGAPRHPLYVRADALATPWVEGER